MLYVTSGISGLCQNFAFEIIFHMHPRGKTTIDFQGFIQKFVAKCQVKYFSPCFPEARSSTRHILNVVFVFVLPSCILCSTCFIV